MFSLTADKQKTQPPTYWSSIMEDTNCFSTLPSPGAPHPSFAGNKQVTKSCHTESGLNLNGMWDEKTPKVIGQEGAEPLQTAPTITAGKGMCSAVRTEGERESAKRARIETKSMSQVHQEDVTPQSPALHPPYLCRKRKMKYPPVARDRQHCLIQLRDLSVYERLESFL